MKVVMAGINRERLRTVRQQISADDAHVLVAATDVSKSYQVKALAHKVLDKFGDIL